jgi:Ca-activated chloride channel family protein
MSPRNVVIVALLAACTSVAGPAWALSCSDIEGMVASGASIEEITALIAASGSDQARLRQCLASALNPPPAPLVAMEPETVAAPARESRKSADAPRPSAATRSAVGMGASAGHDAGGANTEDYTDYGVGGTVLAASDRLSTFSVDVDTASYALSRRKLQEGGLPPESAVRVEEFVNYFAYDYAAPQDGRPFAVHVEGAPDPVTPNHQVLRVGLQGRSRVGERPPVHLTFLVDTSGSMASADKLGLAKQALHELVDHLGYEDTVALATYAGDTRRVLGPTYTTKKETIHAAIEELTSGGGTAMSSGMETAYQMASESYLHGSENRVIVLSDGDANIGQVTHDQILATIQQYAERGITLTTVGFGMGNYKDTMMEQLADKGDGNYYYVDSLQEAQRVFGTNLAGTIETIAKDVKIQVEFEPSAVAAWRLLGYENRDIADQDFRNDKVDAGEVGSGHRVTAVYDLVLKDDLAPTATLATVHLRAKKPGPDSAASEWTTPVQVSSLGTSFAAAGADLRRAWTVAVFAEKLRGSPFEAEIGWDVLHREAARASRGLPEDKELISLIDTAARLSGGPAVAAE